MHEARAASSPTEPSSRCGPPADPATLAYAIVRLGEALLYSDAGAGVRGDVDRLREVEAAMLGVGSGSARSTQPR